MKRFTVNIYWNGYAARNGTQSLDIEAGNGKQALRLAAAGARLTIRQGFEFFTRMNRRHKTGRGSWTVWKCATAENVNLTSFPQ